MPEILGQPALVFARLSGIENVNDLFCYTLELKTPDARNLLHGPAVELNMEAMQGKEFTVEIELDGNGTGLDGSIGRGTRQITGIVTEVRGPLCVENAILYRLTLRPWLWLASLNKNYRIFQQKNVVEIVESVLSEYIFPIENRLIGAVGPQYPVREYQVQYGESDYQFVRRLLAEWGISFFFEHSDCHHRLVLTDGNGAFRNTASPAYHTIKWYPSSDRIDEEHLYEFEVVDRLVAGRWTHTDYDHGKPRADLAISTSAPRKTSHAEQEIYDWPGDYAQPKTGNDPWDEGDMLARIRMEAVRQHGVRVRGKGNVRALIPGCSFNLARFVKRDANREYVVHATRLLIEDIGERTGTEQRWHCEVDFEAQPSNALLRPERVAKPYIHGTLMARVVGPDNQEIWCDDIGRVKVQFPWDREGQNNENSSCYLRTTEFASGDSFGAQFVPRIGQEVTIGFVGGDPDRPYIVGPVNNRLNLPPWSLPSQHALSGYASKEHYAEGRNHLLFDDTQGQQQVQLASDHEHSLLALGHNVRVPNAVGRKDKRGEGFELRTDGRGSIRAQGLLITTEARRKAEGHVLSMQETIRRLEQALAEARNVLEASVAALAQTSEQKDVAQAIAEQNASILGSSEAMGELSTPMMVLASPAGIASTTPKTTHLHSGDHTALTTGQHLSMSAGASIVGSAVQGVSLCGHNADVRLVARKGKVAVEAQGNAMEVVAQQALRIASTEGRVEITAAKEIVFNVGGTYYRMTPDGIESGTSGGWSVYAGSRTLTGPKTSSIAMPSFGQGYSGHYKLHWAGTDQIAPYQPYRITRADGSVFEGVTNARGETGLRLAEFSETLKIEIL